MKFKKSEKLYKKGLVNLVGGVNSPVRAFSSVGGNPLFIKKAKGTKITDVDGNKFVDLVLSYGPMILGHRHKKVQKAVEKALKNINYLEHLSANSINAFKCGAKEMTLIGINTKNQNIDFNKDTLTDFADELNIFKTSKPYNKVRELEIFELLQSGCSLIDEERFNKLNMAHAYSTKQMKN